MAEIVRARFVLELGRLIKGHVVNEIKNAAFMRGLDLTTEESGGILACTIRFELKGGQDAVNQMLGDLKTFVSQIDKALEEK